MIIARVAVIIGLAALQGCVDMTRAKEWTVAELPPDDKGGGVRFTRPDGTVVYVNPRAVAFVRAPLPGEQGNAVIVFTSGGKQAVEETVEQVIHGIHLDMPQGRE